MLRQIWVNEERRTIVCVDSYEAGVLKGRLYSAHQEETHFSSLSQFLVKMEELLELQQMPQAYTTQRTFSSLLCSGPEQSCGGTARRGKVIFRQHTSWQGVLQWREQKAEHSFRSVLELVLLMDSALRSPEGSGVA